MRSQCAHYVCQRYGCSIDGPIRGPSCAHYARTARPLCVSTLPGFKHNGARLHPLCAHFAPTMTSSRFGVQSMGPQSGHYAPTMRPVCARLRFQPLWGSIEGHLVGPLCAHCALARRSLGVKPLWASIYGPTVGPLCAYYAPKMRPHLVLTVLGFNRRAHEALAMRLLCLHTALGFNLWAHSRAIRCAH